MLLSEAHKETLGVAGVNDAITAHFDKFYADYRLHADWADVAQVEATELSTQLSAIALSGTIMNGRAHEFRFMVHRYNAGPFSNKQLAVIAEVLGVSRDVVIMSKDEKEHSVPYGFTPYGGPIYRDSKPQDQARLTVIATAA